MKSILLAWTDDLPYIVIGSIGLLVSWRSLKRHVNDVIVQQNKEIQQKLDAQTRDLKEGEDED